MSNIPSTSKSKQYDGFEDDDLFDDSSLLAHFDSTSIQRSKFSESVINDSGNRSALNVSALCCDEEISGYDKLTGKTWIYPTNYPVRDYQFNIIKSAILKNTLVSLPTGLGKTFIAAVIMYNFYRWYPLGKIVFTAPTRPLVAQQIEACYNIIAIPPSDTIEMTGHMQVNTRKQHWQSKRVFFATPQVIYNDMKSGICPCDKVRCLVIDEAHRARGNYAYCQIISTLDDMNHKIYRVLALSATPGSRVEDVINVVKNLHIAHLELRTENCIDVSPYSHARKINTTIIQLGPQLTQIRQQYIEILDGYARRLKQMNILPPNLGNLSKGRIVMLYKEYQNKDRASSTAPGKINTTIIQLGPQLTQIRQQYIEILDGYARRLKQMNILPPNLGNLSKGRIVMLYKEYQNKDRASSREDLYLDTRQCVRQVRAKKSDTPACNVLVATCVAEEGLDVGSVDLIVCFDISTKSPVRLVQRCGRTGRERGGQVFILVTEGREHQTLQDCMRQRDGLNKKVLQSKEVENNLYKLNPRMIPHDFVPQCQKMFITVEKKPDPKEKSKGGVEKGKKGQKDLRTMLLSRPSTSGLNSSNKETESSSIITEAEFNELFPQGYTSTSLLAKPREYWAMNKEKIKNLPTSEGNELKLTKWLEWQRTLQKTINIHHSKDTEILSELLQYSDAKRFELPPSTQNPCFSSQELQTPPHRLTPLTPVKLTSPAKSKQPPKKKQKVPILKPLDKRDGDIRALFSTATKSTKSYTKVINNLGLQNDGSLPTRLISLLVDLSVDNTNANKKCYVCQNICECSLLKGIKEENKVQMVILDSVRNPKLPNINLIDDFDPETILKCIKKPEENEQNVINNFDLDADFLSPEYDIPSPYIEEQPKNENVSMASDNFDIGDIADIFADSSPEEALKEESPVKEESSLKEEPKEAKAALGYFGLDSIDDIFADDEIDNTPPEQTQKTQHKSKDDVTTQNVKISRSPTFENPRSPSILSGRIKPKEVPTSPILCSQPRKYQLSTKKDEPHSSTPIISCRKQLIKEPTNNNSLISTPAEMPGTSTRDSLNNTTNKSLMTITQLVDMINKTDNNASAFKSNVSDRQPPDDERSTSPILLTQADRNKTVNKTTLDKSVASTSQNFTKSLVILDSDSDSDSDSTQIYDPIDIQTTVNKNETLDKTNVSPLGGKRKRDLDDSSVITASPYFNKKPKLDNDAEKQMSIQEKVLAVMRKNKNVVTNDKTVLSCMVTQPNFSSQKENENPQLLNGNGVNKLSLLQRFRRDSKYDPTKNRVNGMYKCPINSQVKPVDNKRKLAFDDSDDDFVDDQKSDVRNDTEHKPNDNTYRSTTNHKVRKKKKKGNEFLDMEAELSDDDDHSGDELSDESVGSIIDFICDDDNVTHHEDIQAVYLKSIKSPVRAGAFKIPELPKRFNKEDVLSQYVEEDSYEMDSFCVDSNIGLTQGHEVSELELAEMLLEEQRKTKKKYRRICSQDDSPEVKRNKPKRRLIESDSDDDGA
ncbi:hypothetical protein B5X24_HaOG216630 [Helicoverpa armigera]|nr:hypothetical protein B5X24_HaOG216630 [Helicoverpa armigera]